MGISAPGGESDDPGAVPLLRPGAAVKSSLTEGRGPGGLGGTIGGSRDARSCRRVVDERATACPPGHPHRTAIRHPWQGEAGVVNAYRTSWKCLLTLFEDLFLIRHNHLIRGRTGW